ncbi:hypothetical protein Pcinc_018298 [Petrolisthes cinctipes]|uniref:Uncharacterized protein n=1 Tax=Petrolisthes cinctipes TaxID=88211 RepID=A0AAE1FNW2_PETCI|nr:hypothetical protein Pcinc_018298 [Petrolisthes cinctipes]
MAPGVKRIPVRYGKTMDPLLEYEELEVFEDVERERLPRIIVKYCFDLFLTLTENEFTSGFWTDVGLPDDCMEQDPATETTDPWNCSEETTIGLEQKLSHLNVPQMEDFTALLSRYPEVFRNRAYPGLYQHDNARRRCGRWTTN